MKVTGRKAEGKTGASVTEESQRAARVSWASWWVHDRPQSPQIPLISALSPQVQKWFTTLRCYSFLFFLNQSCVFFLHPLPAASHCFGVYLLSRIYASPSIMFCHFPPKNLRFIGHSPLGRDGKWKKTGRKERGYKEMQRGVRALNSSEEEWRKYGRMRR